MSNNPLSVQEIHELRLQKIRNHPAINHIRKRLDADTDFQFSEYLDDFEKIQKSDFLQQVIQFELETLKEYPSHQLAHFNDQGAIRGWPIITTKHFTIGVGIHNPKDIVNLSEERPVEYQSRLSIQPRANDIYVGFIKSLNCSYKLYEVPPCDDNTPLQPGATLKLIREQDAIEGESVYIPAGTIVPTIHINDGYLVYMEIAGNPTRSCVPVFDSKSLTYCGLIGGDPKSSRIGLMTKLLKEFNYVDAIPTMTQIAQHKDHFVRWETIRHVLCMDYKAGMELVEKALHDPHPHVRMAAAQTLKQLQAA